jgi:hypothetical protein
MTHIKVENGGAGGAGGGMDRIGKTELQSAQSTWTALVKVNYHLLNQPVSIP